MSSNAHELIDLLSRWEENYKKGLLSFWILLALHQRPVYAFEMNALIAKLSQGSLSAEDNSIYRALYRFEQLGIVSSEKQPNQSGPDRRYYALTPKGLALLKHFIRRNVQVFYSQEVNDCIEAVLKSGLGEDEIEPVIHNNEVINERRPG